jgi:hypothetical protein
MKTAFLKASALLFLLTLAALLFVTQLTQRQISQTALSSEAMPWQPEGLTANGGNAESPVTGMTDLTQSMARPLMSQTRKPYVEQPVPQEPPPPEPEPPPVVEAPPPEPPPQLSTDGFRLMGLLDSGNVQRALIATLNQPLGVWLKLDDTVDGFKLTSIGENTVTLEAQGQSISLQQYVDKQN